MLFYHKNIHRAFLLIALVALLTGCSSAQDLTGKWKDTKGIGYELIFMENGKGKASGRGGELLDMEYTVDYTKSPIWIDITVIPKDEPKRTALGLIEFVDKNTIKAQINAEERPVSIDPSSIDFLSLKREKE